MAIFWLLRRVVWQKPSDVSEMLTTSIERVMMEAVCISEMPVYFYKTTRRHIPVNYTYYKNEHPFR
jgi:hypothetical protein